MQQGKVLYQLQEIDLKLARNAKRLDEIDQQLADHEAVQNAQAQVDQAQAILKPAQSTMQDIEHQIATTRNKREATEKRLYSGSVTSPKELQDMQHEIESLTKWQAELEERLLNAMVAVEEAEDQYETATNTLNTVTAQVAAENQDLLAEQNMLQTEIRQLEVDRAEICEDIEADNMARYESLRPQKANQPLARLTSDDMCSACGIQQTGIVAKDIRRGESLITCIHCKRILVAL